jgi:hypothetical protein
MRLSNAQRDLVLGLLNAVRDQLPELLEAWKAAGEEDPPPTDDGLHLFTTIRRLPCDMKPEDGPYRYRQQSPHPGVTAERVNYFYEPPPPNGSPTLLVVVTWRGPLPTDSPMVELVDPGQA